MQTQETKNTSILENYTSILENYTLQLKIASISSDLQKLHTEELFFSRELQEIDKFSKFSDQINIIKKKKNHLIKTLFFINQQKIHLDNERKKIFAEFPKSVGILISENDIRPIFIEKGKTFDPKGLEIISTNEDGKSIFKQIPFEIQEFTESDQNKVINEISETNLDEEEIKASESGKESIEISEDKPSWTTVVISNPKISDNAEPKKEVIEVQQKQAKLDNLKKILHQGMPPSVREENKLFLTKNNRPNAKIHAKCVSIVKSYIENFFENLKDRSSHNISREMPKLCGNDFKSFVETSCFYTTKPSYEMWEKYGLKPVFEHIRDILSDLLIDNDYFLITNEDNIHNTYLCPVEKTTREMREQNGKM